MKVPTVHRNLQKLQMPTVELIEVATALSLSQAPPVAPSLYC